VRRTSSLGYVFQYKSPRGVILWGSFYLRRRKKNNGIGTEIGMCYDIADINRLSGGFDSRYLLSREKPMNSRKD